MPGTSAARDAKLAQIELAWEPVHDSATCLRLRREKLSAVVQTHERQFRIGFDPRQGDRDFLLDSVLRGDEAVRYSTQRLSDERAYGVGAVGKTWNAVVSAVAAIRMEYQLFFQAFATHRKTLQRAAEEAILERSFERKMHAACDESLQDVGDNQTQADQKAILDAVKRDCHGLDFAATKLKADKELVNAIIKQSVASMDSIKDELRNDRVIVQEALQRFAHLGWENTSKPQEQLSKALPRTLESLSRGVDKTFRSQDLMDELQHWEEFDDIIDRSGRERAYMLAAVKVTGRAYEFASDSLQEDCEIVFEAVKQHWPVLRLVPAYFLKDAEIVIEGVKQDGRAYEYADSWLREDKNFAFRCMTENGRALEFASKNLRNDFSIVMEAIKTFPRAIAWSSDALRSNKVIVREAVTRDFRALGLTGVPCRSLEIALIAVRQSWKALEFLHADLLDKPEIGLEAVRHSWRAMEFLGPKSRGSYSLAVLATRQDARALRFFDKSVRSNPKLYLETGIAKAMQ